MFPQVIQKEFYLIYIVKIRIWSVVTLVIEVHRTAYLHLLNKKFLLLQGFLNRGLINYAPQCYNTLKRIYRNLFTFLQGV